MLSAKEAKDLTLTSIEMTEKLQSYVDYIVKAITAATANKQLEMNIDFNTVALSVSEVRQIIIYFEMFGYEVTKSPKQPVKGFMVEYPMLFTFSWKNS